MKSRIVTLSAVVVTAFVTGLWVSRAETQPASNATVYFAPSGKEHVVEKALTQLLHSATKSVDLAIFQFTSRELAGAIESASSRVRVRVIADVEQAQGDWTQVNSLKGTYLSVRTVRVPGEDGTESMPKFHHKFCVIDGETVATGSFNWTQLADEQNHENLLVLHDPYIAGQYAAQFQRIWDDERLVTSRRGDAQAKQDPAPAPYRPKGEVK